MRVLRAWLWQRRFNRSVQLVAARRFARSSAGLLPPGTWIELPASVTIDDLVFWARHDAWEHACASIVAGDLGNLHYDLRTVQ